MINLHNRVTVQELEDLIPLLRNNFFALVKMFDSDNIKSEITLVLLILVFLLEITVGLQVVLLVNVEILILIGLRNQVVGEELLLVTRFKYLVCLDEVFD